MIRPRLLDLFSSAGGTSRGYQMAGFEVTGVDHKPQPRFAGDRFIQADALAYLAEHGHEYDAIAASPPCQRFSLMTVCRDQNAHPDLIGEVRKLLATTGKPFVIENVPLAPLQNVLLLCGTYFGLRVIRHRIFESNVYLTAPGQTCWHPRRGKVGKAGHYQGKKPGDWVSVAGRGSRVLGGVAMKINWMTRDELSQAIPPSYTKFIGEQLIRFLREAA